ncbi:hypothetical protein G9U51_14845 [Calidifontibacter sp. DB0510]|uniref:Uncharacterized protein n=1 Tax=Metallococcus carri TaxID=1656884 RepID=A0A967EFY2_9MICO|nr:hypothetical protein [Metallococcus carri]NHN57046.1 hypothetical protein [Metallococcus carri]NOP39085.1 hypothetical protein [Calidifontibacter sp. DB2511S]
MPSSLTDTLRGAPAGTDGRGARLRSLGAGTLTGVIVLSPVLFLSFLGYLLWAMVGRPAPSAAPVLTVFASGYAVALVAGVVLLAIGRRMRGR